MPRTDPFRFPPAAAQPAQGTATPTGGCGQESQRSRDLAGARQPLTSSPAGAAHTADGRPGATRRRAPSPVRYGSADRGAPVPVPPSWQYGLADIGPWPLQDFLELGALPGAVPCARRHIRQVLWEWHLTELADPAELVASELTTNAMQVSRAAIQDTPIRLWLVSDKTQIVILVWDACPLPPVPMDGGR
jgi:hypothetical protein